MKSIYCVTKLQTEWNDLCGVDLVEKEAEDLPMLVPHDQARKRKGVRRNLAELKSV